ncbi:MAG: hypothetical protein M3338_02500 [Actinomycetota bacterium]|nr:hypothetical protein [Actinomycetota bacterium]
MARDAGLRVLLLDKGDISGDTTQWTTQRETRLIHGGLRYLEHYEFALVREFLRDREAILRVVPHLVRPLGFLVPIYDRSARTAHGPIRHDLLRRALLRQEYGPTQDAQPQESSGE